MKTNPRIALFLFLIVLLSGACSSDEDFNYQNEYENSLKSWLSFKETAGNSYQYTVAGGSVFASFGWETIITVTEGLILQREFKLTGNPEDFPLAETSWVEYEGELGSHTVSLAATARTLDEIYSLAEHEWLIKRDNATVYFETENNGLLSSCGYVMDGCMDDCFNGIRISSIEPLYINIIPF